MFHFIIQWCIKNSENTTSTTVQLAYIRLVSWFSIIINIFFSILKVGAGYYYGTIALMSDGLDSFTNVASSIILIFSYKLLASQETLDRPFGSGRIVYIANFIIAMLLVLTGIEMFIMSVKHLIFSHTIPEFNILIGIIITISFLLNEWLAQFCFYISKRIDSTALHTEGLHRRWDNFLSLSVIIAWIGSIYGLLWIDGVIGIVFAGIILHSAYSIAKKNINELVGEIPSSELVEQIAQIGKSIDGVLNIHEIVVHSYGTKIMASMHIELDENLTLKESHFICDQVEDKIGETLNIYTTTHADPINLQTPMMKLVLQYKEELLNSPTLAGKILNMDHIYMGEDYTQANRLFISIDLFVYRPLTRIEEKEIYQELYSKLKQILQKDIRLKIRPRPLFATHIYKK